MSNNCEPEKNTIFIAEDFLQNPEPKKQLMWKTVKILTLIVFGIVFLSLILYYLSDREGLEGKIFVLVHKGDGVEKTPHMEEREKEDFHPKVKVFFHMNSISLNSEKRVEEKKELEGTTEMPKINERTTTEKDENVEKGSLLHLNGVRNIFDALGNLLHPNNSKTIQEPNLPKNIQIKFFPRFGDLGPLFNHRLTTVASEKAENTQESDSESEDSLETHPQIDTSKSSGYPGYPFQSESNSVESSEERIWNLLGFRKLPSFESEEPKSVEHDISPIFKMLSIPPQFGFGEK